MRYKLILFDFDGTLADSFPWFLQTINQVAEKHRFRRIAPHELETLRGRSSRELIAHLEMPMWKLPAVTVEMRRLMKDKAAEIALFPGVDSLLHGLAAGGIEAAVVTSNSEENVRAILGERNASLVRHFECGASMFGKKAKFSKLLQVTGLAPQQVLCVGDEIRDAQAARAAGLDFTGVAWGYTKPEALAPYSCRKPFLSVEEMMQALC
jgi:phosphoglycolate phosphatase